MVMFRTILWSIFGIICFSLWQQQPSHHDDPTAIWIACVVLALIFGVFQAVVEGIARMFRRGPAS